MMTQDDLNVVCSRLGTLRKHLGERLGDKLTIADVAKRSGLIEQQVLRMERELKGTTASLLSLLSFYRSHGYNLDWILTSDNSRIPMIVASGIELQEVGELIRDLNKCLTTGYGKLSGRLHSMGYAQLEETSVVEGQSTMPDAIGLSI